jgi:hypothetical protein
MNACFLRDLEYDEMFVTYATSLSMGIFKINIIKMSYSFSFQSRALGKMTYILLLNYYYDYTNKDYRTCNFIRINNILAKEETQQRNTVKAAPSY